MTMLRLALVAMCVWLASCDNTAKPAYSTSNLDKADRIAAVTRLLQPKLDPLPSAIEEAGFAEHAVGRSEGWLSIGPTDYASYLYVKLAAQDIDRWVKRFTPLASRPAYTAPRDYPPWIEAKDFPSLEFYEPNAMSPRIRGWIGVSRRDAAIFVFSYTD